MKALFTWKEHEDLTIYKCHNHNCSHRIEKLNALNDDEEKLREERSSQFKINYQYREYHYSPADLKVAETAKPKVDLERIHNNKNIFALILTLHISYAITARKTAHMLRNIWDISVSYQTVHFAWLFICSTSKKICAYHFSDNRGAKAAITTMLETVRTVKENQDITLVSDGNPSYQAGIHFINRLKNELKLTLKKVIGLQNMDDESEEYRPFKQMIERLNRTYKYHMQAQNGFESVNGAVAKLVLFVTHYNFLRPHTALNYKTPIQIPELKNIDSLPGKWVKIISLAA
jgi:hypothetical protein